MTKKERLYSICQVCMRDDPFVFGNEALCGTCFYNLIFFPPGVLSKEHAEERAKES